MNVFVKLFVFPLEKHVHYYYSTHAMIDGVSHPWWWFLELRSVEQISKLVLCDGAPVTACCCGVPALFPRSPSRVCAAVRSSQPLLVAQHSSSHRTYRRNETHEVDHPSSIIPLAHWVRGWGWQSRTDREGMKGSGGLV